MACVASPLGYVLRFCQKPPCQLIVNEYSCISINGGPPAPATRRYDGCLARAIGRIAGEEEEEGEEVGEEEEE